MEEERARVLEILAKVIASGCTPDDLKAAFSAIKRGVPSAEFGTPSIPVTPS